MILLRREETGVLVMELSEHLWPEDLEIAIPAVHDVSRSPQNPLLLLVEVASDFDVTFGSSLSNLTTGNFGAESPFASCSADNVYRVRRSSSFKKRY
jgi:hypothetical protein